MKTENKLILEQILWGYGNNNLVSKPVSAEILSPAFILLLGANGTGKSTLLKVLGGLINATAGKVMFNGEPVNKLSKKGGFVSFVFASRPHVDFMKVSDLVMSGFYAHNNPFAKLSRQQLERYEFAMRMTGITALKDNYINKISDGEFQKAMIARALVQDTPLIILDEPTAFLDYRSKRELFELLSQIAKQESKIIFASTHDPDLAQERGELFWLIKNKELQVLQNAELGNKKLKDELI
ncbi:MAG: ABC transporter ATP-binding protein [Bacteroidetes bacterium]|nr:ABC transporter ATP-binding protein [Bacteroidota bacterium]